jgi:hypothetical protein
MGIFARRAKKRTTKTIGTVYITPSETTQVSATEGTIAPGFTTQRTTTGGIVTTGSGGVTSSIGGGGGSGGGTTTTTQTTPSKEVSGGIIGATTPEQDIRISGETQRQIQREQRRRGDRITDFRFGRYAPQPTPKSISRPSSDLPYEDLSAVDRFGIFIGRVKDKPTSLVTGKATEILSEPTFQQTAYYEPQYGTESGFGAFKPITYGMLQKDIELKRGGEITGFKIQKEKELQSEFDIIQGRVSEGTLTVPEAEAMLGKETDIINLEFGKGVGDIYEKYPDVKDIGGRKRGVIGTGTQFAIDVALLSNPLTGVTAGAVSSKEDPFKINMKDLESGGTIESGLTQRPSLRTGVFVTGGVVAGIPSAIKLGKQIDIYGVEESISQASLSQKGFRFELQKDKLFLDITKGRGGSGSIGTTAEIESKAISKALGGDQFLSMGKSDVLITGKRFWSGKPFVISDIGRGVSRSRLIGETTERSSLFETQTMSNRMFSGVFQKGRNGLRGRMNVYFKDIPKQKITLDLGREIDTGMGKFIVGRGGEPKLVSAKFTKSGEKFGLIVPDESKVFLRKIELFPEEKGISFIQKPSKITKTPLSQTFGRGVVQQTKITTPPAIKFELPTAKQVFDIKPVTRTQPQSIYAGTGLYERTSQTQDLLPRQLQPQLQRAFSLSGLASATGMGQRTTNIIKQDFSSSIKLASKQLQGLQTKQVQKSLLRGITPITKPKTRPGFDDFFNFRIPPILPFFPPLGQIGGRKKKKKKRRFVETPTFAGVTLGEFGAEFKGQRTKREKALGVPLEVGFKKVKLPQVL